MEGERKWQTQTDERQRENSTGWGTWTGRPHTLQLEWQVQRENETQRHDGIGPVKPGASGTRPLSRQPSSCWAAKARAVPRLQGSLSTILLHHSSASISRCQLGPVETPGLPPSHHHGPDAVVCWEGGYFGDGYTVSKIQQTLQKKKKHCRDCSVAKLCPASCDPMGCSTPGFPVLHYLLGFAQTHIH